MAIDGDGAAPSPLVDFIAGTVGGVASLLAGHPFDTIKTRLQAQPHAAASINVSPASAPLLANASAIGRPPRYTSALDALRRIVAEERVAGLYKGVTSPMLGVAAMNASVFGVYGVALRVLSRSDDPAAAATASSPTLTNIFLAGCASGMVSALITSPIELIKIRQQLTFDASREAGRTAQPTTWSVIRGIWRRGGVRGLYRGLGCTCIRDVGYGPYFLSYEALNRFLLSLHAPQSTTMSGRAPLPPRLSNVEMALSGGIAGVIAWLSTFGVDVIKTRVQATERGANGERGSAFLQAARSTYAQGGWRAFLAGAGPTVIRALPVNAVLFITFEATKDSLIGWGY